MRIFSSPITACLLGWPLLVRCDTPPQAVSTVAPGGISSGIPSDPTGPDTSSQGAPSSLKSSISSTVQTTSPSSKIASSTAVSITTSVSSEVYITTTTTINVSPLVSASASSSSTISTSTPSSVTSLVTSSTSTSTTADSSSAMSSDSSVSTNNQSARSHRTLVIVLSTVLGFFGLALIASAFFLWYCYRRGKWPFGHRRGASPIGDDEIASWRRHTQEQKLPPPTPDTPRVPNHPAPIPLAYSPGWTWTASPTSIRTVSVSMPESPSFVAKAPNSRVGLTDETIPGAVPFIPPIKRQSSRLSKQPPRHSREKSRKSSISAKSSWSLDGRLRGSSDVNGKDRMSTWYDSETKEEQIQPRIITWYNPEDEAVSQSLKDAENGSSTPGTSIFNELELAGGLSPRPKSRSKSRRWGDAEKGEIGRAIG